MIFVASLIHVIQSAVSFDVMGDMSDGEGGHAAIAAFYADASGAWLRRIFSASRFS